MSTVHVILPNDIDDPARPSGGNVYDRRICQGLAASGWSVHEHAVPGDWPRPGDADRRTLARELETLPDAAIVLVDGLVASAVPDVLVPHARRVRLVVLVHLPVGDAAAELRPLEGRVLCAAAAVLATSDWSRRRLLELYRLPVDRVHVAAPGVDPAPLAPGSPDGSRLVCVGAVAPHKGHDVLVEALATITERPWRCVCVGPLDRDPAFVKRLHRRVRARGMGERITFVGPCTGPALDARYAAADLLVLASRGETYGMVVTEALARGIPVLATAVKGLPEALGWATDGSRPGILVPPGDPVALAGALERWLGERELRRRLRRSARGRRTTLTAWARTSDCVSNLLSGIAATVDGGR